MQPWQDRLIQERNDLYEKLTKLVLFKETPIFKNLPDDDKLLLARQQAAMNKYLEALDDRINRLK